MDTISKDISIYVLWKYLPVEDILKYCKVNKEFHTVCNDPEVWRYLLKRDFNIDSDSTDTKKEYMYEYERKKLIEKHKNIVHSLNINIGKFKKHSEPLLIIVFNNENRVNTMNYKPKRHDKIYTILKYRVKRILFKGYITINIGFDNSYKSSMKSFYDLVIELIEKVFYGQRE